MIPPQLGDYSPPALIDDAMREIFLRVPPEDPATLARASAVCTTWSGIISDADFGREYRAFHGAPPVLGFLHNSCDESGTSFTSTTVSLRSPACHDRQDLYALDSRHGLVLFNAHDDGHEIMDFVVCDLVTHEQWSVHAPPGPGWSDVHYWWKAAVLCARGDRCDHRDCSEGAFLVALVGTNNMAILASVYSSETGEWSDTISIEKPIHFMEICRTGHRAIVGNKVYLPCGDSNQTMTYRCRGEKNLMVEYDMGAQELAVIGVPLDDETGAGLLPEFFVGAEDGVLLFADVEEPELHLWSVEPGSNGAARRRVIDLQPLLPRLALGSSSSVTVVGFAEGPGVIFLSTEEELFTVDLSSCRSKKVHAGEYSFSEDIIPYSSFYTGGHGGRGKRAVVGATRRWTGLLWLYGENLQ